MKFFKTIGLMAIVLFSFYYTEKIANFVLVNNELYQTILENKDQYEVSSIAASIEDDYIIPGLDGIKVDVKDSYYNMKAVSAFNAYYLIYKEDEPTISIEQNKDKIIKEGNKEKNSIALVLEYDENLINHLSNYPISVLVNYGNFHNNVSYEVINNEVMEFKKLESLINKYLTNPNICFINNQNEQICRDNHKYLVEASKILNNSTYLNVLNEVKSGDIILINKGTNPKYVDSLLKTIAFKDYELNYLSKHISEDR